MWKRGALSSYHSAQIFSLQCVGFINIAMCLCLCVVRYGVLL